MPEVGEHLAKEAATFADLITAEKDAERWTTTKPDYACVFVGKTGENYSLWRFEWQPGEAPENTTEDDCDTGYYYLAWIDDDGDEYDDIDECHCEKYLVIDVLPTLEEI